MAGRPWVRRHWVKVSSQLLAAAKAPCPGEPTSAAAEENEQNQGAQRRFLQDQQAERARVNARFDEELAKLRPLWAQQAGMPVEAKK